MVGYTYNSIVEYCENHPSIYNDVCLEVVSDTTHNLLLDETDYTKNCFMRLDEEVGKCHYDNGVGLNEKEWYFSHLGRDIEFYSWFDDIEIDRFEIINDSIYVFLSMSREELVNIVRSQYDGSDYDSDF